jgi:hypothetical protein
MVSRARAKADGFAAVTLKTLAVAPAAGFASGGFASAGFAPAGFASAGFAPAGFASAGFAPAGAAGGAASATATQVPRETVTENANPYRILVMDFARLSSSAISRTLITEQGKGDAIGLDSAPLFKSGRRK